MACWFIRLDPDSPLSYSLPAKTILTNHLKCCQIRKSELGAVQLKMNKNKSAS